MHRDILAGQRSVQSRSVALEYHGPHSLTLAFSIISGELPPPPPRACFGREELIEKIIGLADGLTPIALIGAGGIGKTSIALTILHDNRIKQRFGDDRRFIRCDQFSTSRPHFLSRLSKVIGAGVENPEDLAPLRPFLSSKEMLIVLDNAESILDPQGTDAQEIYTIVEELGQLNNICLCITSRISTIPPDCETLVIPTLSMEAACNAFYRIYKNGEQPGLINNLLEQLDFHPLSITLLATVAHHNMWDPDWLAKEWDQHHTGILQTEHNKSLAAAIELSLSSPMFQELGPDTRDLLGVVAFFPQGVNKNNLDWLFPSISNISKVFDKFCILSLAYQSNGFITMLAPLRDYLSPKDPRTSPLLCATKECYFHRLSVDVTPNKPGFQEAQWVLSEDVNVEHLLNVFMTIDATSGEIWDACGNFLRHLAWHKPQLVMLGPKIEGLPDDHPSKPQCLVELSRLFESVGNHMEYKRLLVYASKLWRGQGNYSQVAHTLLYLADANRLLGHNQAGIFQAKEALEIYKHTGSVFGQAQSLQSLAWLLSQDHQLAAAKVAASLAIRLALDQGEQTLVSHCHRVLGDIYQSEGKIEEAIDHFEAALAIALSLNWSTELFQAYYSLAELFLYQDRFDEANTYIGHAKPYTINNLCGLGRMMEIQAWVWFKQHRLEEAKAEALCAIDVYEKLKSIKDVEDCRVLLREIEEEENPDTSLDLNFSGKLLM